MSKAQEGSKPGSKDNRILCFLRVRPPNGNERDWFSKSEYQRFLLEREKTPDPDHSIVVRSSGKQYDFDGVFWEDSQQRDVFKITTVPTLENVFAGYCGAVMAYGQTGTGKTHTMQGYKADRGMIPRCAEYIFNRIDAEKNSKYKVTCNFVQIYLDKLDDLFNPGAPEVQIDPEAERVKLPDITERSLSSAEEMMKYYREGEKHRVTRKTKMNDTSSRGHAALIINIEGTSSSADGPASTKIGKLVLIDLAGYERFTQTGISGGIAEQEAKKINSSLLALGAVVNALADKDKHVPFRNAKLTRLLKDCLGGTAKTSIICTVGPCDKYKQETGGTLYFGWRAMAVKTHAKIQSVTDPTQFMAILQTKVKDLQERIQTMASWWHKSHPNDYAAYCQKYGDPGVDLNQDIDFSQLAPADGMAGGGTNAAALLEADGPANAEVQKEREEFRQDVSAEEKRHQMEKAAMAAHHKEQMDALKAAGADERQLAELAQQNQDEMKVMEDMYGDHLKDLMQDQSRREMAILLQSAMNDLGPISRERESRLRDMIEHLMNTCDSKNEMLARLFELVCHVEEQIRERDSTIVGIQRVMEDVDEQNRRHWADREAQHRTQLMLMREKFGSSGAPSGSGTVTSSSGPPGGTQTRSSRPSTSAAPSSAVGGPPPSSSSRAPGGSSGAPSGGPMGVVRPGQMSGAALPAGSGSGAPRSGDGVAHHGGGGGAGGAEAHSKRAMVKSLFTGGQRR